MEPVYEDDPFNSAAFESFGIPYIYPYQRLVVSNIIEALSEGEETEPFRHQIVILPTGSGKTLCFTLPAAFTKGLTLIVFPLLSLMADQARRMESGPFPAVILKGGQAPDERESVLKKIENNQVRFVLSNPETLQTEKIRSFLKQQKLEHIVIDETHTVSEWGDSFRPAYLKMGEIIGDLSPKAVTAFTATASSVVLQRVTDIIFSGREPHIIAANPDRTNIYYSVIPVLAKARFLSLLCRRMPRPILIFCSSRLETEKTALNLRISLNEKEIFFYHAGLSREEKKKTEDWYFQSKNGILTATCAYGMGVDKADIRTVIHNSLPGSVEAYLQESGRGGRDRKPAVSILLYSPEERIKWQTHKDPLYKKRFETLIRYAENNKLCRREQLLRYFNAEPEDCDLCDCCREETVPYPQEVPFLQSFFRTGSFSFGTRETVLILKGLNTPSVKSKGWNHLPHFGTLQDWEMEDIEEMLRNGILSGLLKLNRFPIAKNKIFLRNWRDPESGRGGKAFFP